MVEKGESNLLTTDKVIWYAPTSGTTSKSKLFPKFVAPAAKQGPRFERVMLFVCWCQDASIPLGVPITPGGIADFGAMIDAYPAKFVAPPETYQISDFASAMYVQMVFGLKESSLECILSGFCPTTLSAFTLLAQEWELMITDIRNGTLKPSLNLTQSQRTVLEEAMGKPDPQRADELDATLSKSMKQHNFKSVARHLWPKLSLVMAVAGGSFVTYIPQLQHYLDDNIHISAPLYVASEELFGINKWPYDSVSAYSLQTNQIFFEFIPLADSDSRNPQSVLLADEINAGEVYEIVVTTSGGLYRYRMGDLIKVLEERDTSEPPVIDVLGHMKLGLNICGEKVVEYQVTTTIAGLTGPGGPCNQSSIQDYMVTADMKSFPPVYQVWIEFSPRVCTGDTDSPSAILSEVAVYVDKKLAEMNTLCLLYTSPSPRDATLSRMPSSA